MKMKYYFPLKENERLSKIALYGAGTVGNDYYQQFCQQGLQIVLWVDKDEQKIMENTSVQRREKLLETVFDIIIIAVKDEWLAKSIEKELVQFGIDNKKILWRRPENKRDYAFIYNDCFLKEVYEWRIGKFAQQKECFENLKEDMEALLFQYDNIKLNGAFDTREWYVNEQKKLMYLNNAKVACTSLKACLLNASQMENYLLVNQTLAAQAIRGKVPSGMQEYYKYTYVRNPFSRLVSCYMNKYHSDKSLLGGKSSELLYGKTRYLLGWLKDVADFKEFVDKVVMIPEQWQERHFALQYNLIYDNGMPVVDYVGKFEELPVSYEHIQEKFNTPQLPVYNKTSSGDWKQYYDLDIAEKVYEKYKKDIETFGYEKECQSFLEELRKKDI